MKFKFQTSEKSFIFLSADYCSPLISETIDCMSVINIIKQSYLYLFLSIYFIFYLKKKDIKIQLHNIIITLKNTNYINLNIFNVVFLFEINKFYQISNKRIQRDPNFSLNKLHFRSKISKTTFSNIT